MVMVMTCAPESINAVHCFPSIIIVLSLDLPMSLANGSGL